MGESYCAGNVRVFARGRWAASFDSLGAALTAAAKQHDTPIGPHSFRFFVLENQALNEPSCRRWMIGLGHYDLDTFWTESAGRLNPDFEGWPYAEVVAREAPGGLAVVVSVGPAYEGLTREYLGRLVQALSADGLKVDDGPEPQPLGGRLTPATAGPVLVDGTAGTDWEPPTPRRRTDFNRWCHIWSEVKRRVSQGYSVRWIHDNEIRRKGIRVSLKTLGRIVRAGTAGYLERPVPTE